MARSALMTVMTQAATKAGRSLTRDFGEVQNLQVSVKGPAEFVRTAERKAEEMVHAELTRARPDWGFLSESRGAAEGRDPQHRWIVDPIDGALNFLHGIPHFAISIALEREGQVVAAVVFNPVLDELYTAEKGGGAFLNDRRIRVAARGKLHDCVLSTAIPAMGQGDHARFLFEARTLMGGIAGLRRLGASALDLGYVAAGRFDGYWESGAQPWSIAAGSILVREAGGFVTDLDGGRFDSVGGEICCANELVHKALVAELKGARTAQRPPRPADAAAAGG